MASSERGPKGRQSAYHRWELAALPSPGEVATAKNAEREMAELRSRAEVEGRAAGYAAGIAAAAAERARLTALVQSLSESVGDHEQKLVDEVLDLALVLARQLVGEALSVRREYVLPVVSAALRQLPQSTQRIELRLNPADAELVRSLLAAEPLGTRCQLEEDPSIAPGGCLIDTEQSGVDMTIASRWRRLMASLGRSDDWLEPV